MTRDVVVVPGRPADGALQWWALVPAGATPQFRLTGPGATPPVAHALRRAGDPVGPGDAYLVAAVGLTPDRPYTLAVSAGTAAAGAASRTLPRSLAPDEPFTVALGSCYCVAKDDELIHLAYPPHRHRADGTDPVRLRFLCGDQLYMDLSAASGTPHWSTAPDPWDKYGEQWRRDRYAPFLAASPSLCLADDHEFWNDYPFRAGWLAWSGGGRHGTIARRLDRTFAVFQVALNLPPAQVHADAGNPAAIDALLDDAGRSFAVDGPGLSFLVLDTRTARDDRHFARAGAFRRALAWVAGLRAPGVVVLAQPAVAQRPGFFARLARSQGFGDHGLPDYERPYAALWEALFRAPHDVLVLTGDIHWSRLNTVVRSGAAPSRRVVELVSSPLARIPRPPFPFGLFAGDPEVPKERDGKVKWDGGEGTWRRADDVAGRPDGYATVARQSFATVTFVRQADGSLRSTARAWRRDALTGGTTIVEGAFQLR